MLPNRLQPGTLRPSKRTTKGQRPAQAYLVFFSTHELLWKFQDPSPQVWLQPSGSPPLLQVARVDLTAHDLHLTLYLSALGKQRAPAMDDPWYSDSCGSHCYSLVYLALVLPPWWDQAHQFSNGK